MADKILKQFATTEAIQCMGIYKFVQKLGNKELEMPFLQVVNNFLLTCQSICSVLALKVPALCEARWRQG